MNQIHSLRAMLKKDKENSEGLLSKCLLFLYTNDVATISSLSSNLIKYYLKDYDRKKIYRVLNDLRNIGLVGYFTANYLEKIGDESLSEVGLKAKKIHKEFVSDKPKPYRIRFLSTKYYYVTKKGEDLIPSCCEMLDFDYKKINGHS